MGNIIINGEIVKPGHYREINIPIANLPTHTKVDLPVFVFRGKKDGPSLLLTAGLHGDEVNGTEVIRRMIHEKMLMPEKGTVIAIPIINVLGFIHQMRDLPDGKDLNRSFPGNKNGSLAMRTAYVLKNEILPHIDYGVDFHTGGAKLNNYPHVRCVTHEKINLTLAKAFGAPMILNSGMIDKSFRKEAWKMGKSLIVYEGGESMRFDEFAIEEGIAGVRRMMNALRMKRTSEKKRNSLLLRQSKWIRARHGGLFRPLITYGAKVKKNQVLALLTDTYGKSEVKVHSHENGFVVGVNNHPIVNAGDALINIGIV